MYSPVEGAKVLEASAEVQEMLEWARSQGIEWPKVVYPVLFPPGYIGTMATSEIMPNERIITAPSSALMTSQVARECPELQELFTKNPEISNRGMLAMVTFMIWEKQKGPESKWAAFIKYQPQDANNLQDWSDAELLELQDKDLMFDSKQKKEYHEYGWNYWKNCIEKLGLFTSEMISLESYTWAFRVISTRCFGKFMPYLTMFPVGELLNHHNSQSYYIYQFNSEKPDASRRYSGVCDDNDRDDDLVTNDKIVEASMNALLALNKQIYKVKSEDEKLAEIEKLAQAFDERELQRKLEFEKVKPDDMEIEEHPDKHASICAGPDEHYLPGSEVYMSYGRYSNRQLLSSYGFCLLENKYNYHQLKVSLQDLILDGTLSQSLASEASFLQFKLKQFHLCEDLLNKLRCLNWSSSLSANNFFNPVDLSLESQIIQQAIKLIEKSLSAYPTSYEEDQAILSQSPSLRLYFAVLYRSQQKQILSSQLQYLQSVLAYISSSDSSLLTSLSNPDQRAISSYLSKLPLN